MTAALIFCMAALLCPPVIEEPHLPNPFARLRQRWNSQSRTRRELTIFAIALGLGLLLLPWLIYLTGANTLGPYARGGALRFYGDFFAGLGQGSLLVWLIALGPALFLLLFRLFWRGARAALSQAPPPGV